MRSVFKSFMIGAAACLCFMGASSAQAEVFFVEDQNDGFSVTFPDTWALTENQKADDKLTVTAPGTNALASCRVRVREDRRFLIYPPTKFSDAVQKVGFSKKFWENYLGEYDDVNVEFFKDEAGVGEAFASMVEASYTTATGTIAHKRGIMFAGLYRDNVYILDCAAQEDAYAKWRPDFMGIIKSVDMRQEVHQKSHGAYRDFNSDADIVIQGPKDERIKRY